jgi:hypothetical protein
LSKNLVQIGGEGLGANLVLAVKQVAPLVDFFNRSLVLAGQPLHAVAHHGLRFFAARVANDALATCRLYQEMAAVAGHHQAGLLLQDKSASM